MKPWSLKTVLYLAVIGAVAAGIFAWFWSRRRVEASVTVPQDEIVVTRVKPTSDGGAIYLD